ncbi:DNA resolvase [Kozakia baliensis NRIC 0488]|nr:DNA resolvase [Kozakia baliensis NRIC 0488]
MGQRAVIYCRVSTADQSCVRHKDELKRFAERAGYEVSGIFMETGSGVRVDRAERRKVMALAQAREIDAILVTELSRWGRSTIDLISTLQELESYRVSLIAMNGDDVRPGDATWADAGGGSGRDCRVRAGSDQRAGEVRSGCCQGTREGSRPTERRAAEI